MRLIYIIQTIKRYFNLESELESYEKIHEEILKGIIFKGTNLWILVFAIVVASVGLNMNSTAVIIGAMLISPLMGPINGMGYSIATYNFELFRQSLKNFLFAVATSLVASTTYFALSPISTAHSELLARTSPSIYDVLIALFGGLAGIVAISSKQKGNVIPGVAIATALMPPLCTAGYGLATHQYSFFFGALYLFTINSVFIAIASVSVSQILKFPIWSLVDKSKKKKINRLISTVIIIVILPSIYFGYGLVQKEKFIDKANRYISNVSSFEGNFLLRHEVDASKKTITLVYGGINLSDNQKELISQKTENFDLRNTKVEIKQGLAFESFDDKNIEVFRLREELYNLNNILKHTEHKLDSVENRGFMGQTILSEIKSLYPQITSCSFGETYEFRATSKKPVRGTLVILTADKNKLNNAEKERINNWLRTRLNEKNIKVIYE